MKHNRSTINIAFSKSADEGKKELLKHWTELIKRLNVLVQMEKTIHDGMSKERLILITNIKEILDIK